MSIVRKLKRGFKIVLNTFLIYKNPEINYYNQYSLRYFFKPYGQEKLGTTGCGPFACAIVASSLLKEKVSPEETAKWACENGFYEYRHGTYHSMIPAFCQRTGLKCEDLGYQTDELEKRLDNQDTLAILLCKEKTFSSGRHFVVVGKSGGWFKVYNSGNVLDCYRKFDKKKIEAALAVENVYIGPIWCISKE